MVDSVAPIRHGQRGVDADKVEVGIRPERVEMEIDIAAAVLRLMAEAFRPVDRRADPGAHAENGTHLGCQGHEGGDGGLDAGA